MAVEIKHKMKEAVKTDERAVEFVPFGATTKLRLTAAMVKNFIAVPSKKGNLPTERDCIKFIMLCAGKRANPFEGDCFLIGYDNSDGSTSFTMVTGIELFLKRAEQADDFNGFEYGIVVQSEKELIERQGTVYLPTEKIVGGWAKVYKKNREKPFCKSVNFSVYDTGYSRWKKDPAGQIAKVALSQALRESYPTPLGGLYTQEEMQKVIESGNGMMQIEEKKSPAEIMGIEKNEFPMPEGKMQAPPLPKQEPESKLTPEQQDFANKL